VRVAPAAEVARAGQLQDVGLVTLTALTGPHRQ